MVSEFKEKDPGMKCIKAGDFYGFLVHGMHSGVILRGANEWREQGYRGSQGDRSTMVLVNNLRLVATYQPVWNGENEEFLVFREELDSICRPVSRKELLLIGGDFNSNVGYRPEEKYRETAGPQRD